MFPDIQSGIATSPIRSPLVLDPKYSRDRAAISDFPSMQPNHAFDPFLLEGLSVLVVEDALPVAKAMKGLLEQYKIDVVGPVATADDARRQLAIRRPQAALVDINLEGEPAWGLIDDLWDEQVDVIVSSGDPQLADTTRASMIHLQKPYDAAELLSALCAIAQKLRSNIDRRSRVD